MKNTHDVKTFLSPTLPVLDMERMDEDNLSVVMTMMERDDGGKRGEENVGTFSRIMVVMKEDAVILKRTWVVRVW